MYSGPRENGCLVELNSHEISCDPTPSFFGELKGVCWAVQEVKNYVRGAKLSLLTDSKGGFKRVGEMNEESTKECIKKLSELEIHWHGYGNI